MSYAQCEVLEDDGSWYCEIPECPGVWSNGMSCDEALDELQSTLRDWVMFGLRMQAQLPSIDGITLTEPR